MIINHEPRYTQPPQKGGTHTDMPDENGLSMIDRLGLAYCRLNCSEWDDILGPKPEGFDDLPSRSPKQGIGRKHQLCKEDFLGAALRGISSIIGEANCSRCWWKFKLGKSEEEWFRWYVTDRFREFR